MHYYNISLLGSPLEAFTYQSSQNIDIGTKVSLKVRNRDIFGAIISTCNDPKEAVKGATVVTTDTWTSMGQEEEKEGTEKNSIRYK